MSKRQEKQEASTANNAETQPQNQPPFGVLEKLQLAYQNEYRRLLKLAEQGRLAQQQRYVEARKEFSTTIEELRQEVLARGAEALQAYADTLQQIMNNPVIYDQCVDAYQTYFEAANQLATSQRETEQNAANAYQDYRSAIQSRQDEAEVQRLGEHAQQAYLEALPNASRQMELQQKASEAQAAFYQLYQEAQTANRQAVNDAYQSYLSQVQETLDQINVRGRYEAALQQYQNQLTEIAVSTQQIALEANIKVLQELSSALEPLAAGATKFV